MLENRRQVIADRILKSYTFEKDNNKVEIQKSEEIITPDNTIFSETLIDKYKDRLDENYHIKKSFETLRLGDPDLLCKGSISRAGLNAVKVQVKDKNGMTHWAIRWKKGNDEVHAVDHKKFQESHKDLGNHGTTHEEQIQGIAHSDLEPVDKAKKLIHLGIFDKGTLEKLAGVSGQEAYDLLYYAGVKGRDFKDGHDQLKENKTNTDTTTGKMSDEIVSMSIEDARNILSSKELDKVKTQKKLELSEKYGINIDDKWNSYEFKLKQVIDTGYPKSLVVYGTGGVGKTFILTKTLNSRKLIARDPEIDQEPEEYDYVSITGSTSKSDMYNIMYMNKNKVVIFDDCDSMWNDDEAANILKGALDTTGDGTIRYGNPKKLPDGSNPPKSFRFTGQCIFISNLKRSDLPAPIVDSRSSAIDLTMTMDQTLDRLDAIKDFIKLQDKKGEEIVASKEDRKQGVEFLREFRDYLRVEQVNGRTLGQLIGIAQQLRSDNEFTHDRFIKESLIVLDLV